MLALNIHADKRLYTAIGYNKRGRTKGTVFGKAMAELLTGLGPDDLPLPVSSMAIARNALAMSRLYETAFAMNQIIRSL